MGSGFPLVPRGVDLAGYVLGLQVYVVLHRRGDRAVAHHQLQYRGLLDSFRPPGPEGAPQVLGGRVLAGYRTAIVWERISRKNHFLDTAYIATCASHYVRREIDRLLTQKVPIDLATLGR